MNEKLKELQAEGKVQEATLGPEEALWPDGVSRNTNRVEGPILGRAGTTQQSPLTQGNGKHGDGAIKSSVLTWGALWTWAADAHSDEGLTREATRDSSPEQSAEVIVIEGNEPGIGNDPLKHEHRRPYPPDEGPNPKERNEPPTQSRSQDPTVTMTPVRASHGETKGESNAAQVETETGLIEQILARQNLQQAWKQVKSNRGAPGIDGLTIKQYQTYAKEHWPITADELRQGEYQPGPVRRVEIAKPDGGIRGLGIPNVQDRLIQQAISQVLSAIWEPLFSESSYGFRPKRSAHQAVKALKQASEEGLTYAVDIDLAKFFDTVDHGVLMNLLRKQIKDRQVLQLIRRFLTAGVMVHGKLEPSVRGVPQGGPLSPLLANIVLNEMDQELARRGHRFARYADDCVPRTRSERKLAKCATAQPMREHKAPRNRLTGAGFKSPSAAEIKSPRREHRRKRSGKNRIR